MVSEIVIGRRAGNSPVNAMRRVAVDSNTTPLWRFVGWSGIFAGVLILSFYSVIAGICLNYIFISATSSGALSATDQFSNVISSPLNLLFWHTVFMTLTALIVSAGIKDGIGRNGQNINATAWDANDFYGYLRNESTVILIKQ